MNTRERFKDSYVANAGRYALSKNGHIVYWSDDGSGKEYCFTLAIFNRSREGYDLHFVGNHPFEYSDDGNVSFMAFAAACQKYMDAVHNLEDLESEGL
jgi:hypothetical protein